MKVADLHCDTILKLHQQEQAGKVPSLYQNDFHIDIQKLQQGDYLLQNFAMFVYLPKTKNPYLECCQMIDCYYRHMEKNAAYIAHVTHADDIEKNWKNGKISALLTMEEGAPLQGKVEKLQEFYALGVRLITLTWNFPNEIGYPNFDESIPGNTMEVKPFGALNTQNGLTASGIDVVQAMEELGMLIDVSHGSDALFEDVLKYTAGPVIASHSNARALSPHSRNLTDDMVVRLAERGGLVGMNYCPAFISENGCTSVADIVRHIKYIHKIAGIDVLALGSDFDGISNNLEIKDASMMPLLYNALKKEQFTEAEIEKIFHGNVLRVYKEVLK